MTRRERSLRAAVACAEDWARDDDSLRQYMGDGILELLDTEEYEKLPLKVRLTRIKTRMKKSIDAETRNFMDEVKDYKKEVLDDD